MRISQKILRAPRKDAASSDFFVEGQNQSDLPKYYFITHLHTFSSSYSNNK